MNDSLYTCVKFRVASINVFNDVPVLLVLLSNVLSEGTYVSISRDGIYLVKCLSIIKRPGCKPVVVSSVACDDTQRPLLVLLESLSQDAPSR